MALITDTISPDDSDILYVLDSESSLPTDRIVSIPLFGFLSIMPYRFCMVTRYGYLFDGRNAIWIW